MIPIKDVKKQAQAFALHILVSRHREEYNELYKHHRTILKEARRGKFGRPKNNDEEVYFR